MMRIVVLDGFTLNPGDLSWDALKALGACEIYDRTSRAELQRRAEHAEILLTNKTELDRTLISSLPNLRYIGVLATGTNMVDLHAALERNIPVTKVPAYGTSSVAQTTIALLLELTQHVGNHSETVRKGEWSRSPDWCYWRYPLIELEGLTLGVVGLGRIGLAVAKLGAAFGMKIVASTHNSNAIPSFVERLGLDELFRQSDVISLHCPLTPQTKHIVNARSIALMKPGAFLVNTSRGQLVEDAVLAEALNSGRIAGAGLDVLSTEPPPASNPLLQAKNCIITPHLAWGTHAARSRLMRIAVENVSGFLAGNPINVVN